MYRVLVIEDDGVQQQILKRALQEYPNGLMQIDAAGDYGSAIERINHMPYDFYVLDVRLSDQDDDPRDGIAVGKYIRTVPGQQFAPIIFITAIPDRIRVALNETQCMFYLLKPWTSDELYTCIDRILHSPMVSSPYVLVETVWGGMVKIPEKDILFIDRNKSRKIIFHSLRGDFETRQYTLAQLEIMLQAGFLRIHRNCIINKEHLQAYSKTGLRIEVEGHSLPVGRSYKDKLDLYWRTRK